MNLGTSALGPCAWCVVASSALQEGQASAGGAGNENRLE